MTERIEPHSLESAILGGILAIVSLLMGDASWRWTYSLREHHGFSEQMASIAISVGNVMSDVVAIGFVLFGALFALLSIKMSIDYLTTKCS